MEPVSVRVVGSGAAGILLGGLLARAGHPVSFEGPPEEMRDIERGGLRLVLPSGWATVRAAPAGRAGARLVLVAGPLPRPRPASRRAAPRRQLLGIGPAEKPVLINGTAEDLPLLATPDGEPSDEAAPVLLLALLEAVRPQPSDVELCGGRPALMWRKGTLPAGLFTPLKAAGFELAEVEPLDGAADALFLWRLPDLPAALCGMSRGYFLSFREGREIALRVLEEGLAVLTRLRRKPARLPRRDPMELLKALRKGGAELERARCRPERAFSPLLRPVPPGLLALDAEEARELGGRLVRLGEGVGVEARWCARLVQRVERVLRQGPFPDPARLMEAVE